VLHDASIDTLAASGILDAASAQPFANALIGLAGLQGKPKPAIHDVAHFRAALLAAQSIAHTQFGPSGRYFPELIAALGITEAMACKVVTRPGGYIGRVVMAGEADMAFQQICELLAVPGLEVIGPIPAQLQRGIISKIALFADGVQRELANTLLAFLSRPEHEALFQKAGLKKLI
jgi:molybdate transport system substrate-binding protein